MEIREFLAEIGSTYDSELGINKGVYAQDLLRAAADHFGPHVPPGWQVSGNGGQGSAGFTPWVGVFSPNVTLNPHRGLYIVYLFAKDLKTVTLALNQGVSDLLDELRLAGTMTVLEKEAHRLIQEIPALRASDLREPMELGCQRPRQRAYEAGAVATRRYTLANLPSEDELRSDLWHMAELLELAALNQAEVRCSGRSEAELRDFGAATRVARAGDPVERFKPKDASDYETHLAGRTLTKHREHEALIEQFGRFVQEKGFSASTNVHPRDLTLTRGTGHWLVEAKAIYTGNATQAVREATGQLLTYRHFLYRAVGKPDPYLVGLFTESVGDGYVQFLESMGIGSVWRTPQGWEGSPLSSGWGLL